MAQKMIPNKTRLRDSRGTDEGTFLGWDEDGAAIVMWDGYDDDDSTFAYVVIG